MIFFENIKLNLNAQNFSFYRNQIFQVKVLSFYIGCKAFVMKLNNFTRAFMEMKHFYIYWKILTNNFNTKFMKNVEQDEHDKCLCHIVEIQSKLNCRYFVIKIFLQRFPFFLIPFEFFPFFYLARYKNWPVRFNSVAKMLVCASKFKPRFEPAWPCMDIIFLEKIFLLKSLIIKPFDPFIKSSF